MKKFNQKKFNDFIVTNQVVGFFGKPMTLVSGRTTHWYVNWRRVSSDVYLIDKLSDFLLSFVKDQGIKADTFYGVPEGATKLAILSQYKKAKSSSTFGSNSHVLSMGRGKQKDHGDPNDRVFVGIPKGKVAILEDVTTTGGSLVKTIRLLKDSGFKVSAAIALTNRNEITDEGEPIPAALKAMGVPYFALSNALELLPYIANKSKLGVSIVQSIRAEFTKYGESKISI